MILPFVLDFWWIFATIELLYAVLAQRIEHLPYEEVDGGSNPPHAFYTPFVVLYMKDGLTNRNLKCKG